MRTLAIADLFLPSQVLRDALGALAPSAIHIIEWPTRDKSDLHHRVRRIERDGPEIEAPPDAIWPHVEHAELIVTHMCPIAAAVIERAANLTMIGVCRAGTETIATAAAEARGIRVINVPGRNARAVAEFAVGLMISERRNIARAHHAIVNGRWRKDFPNTDQDTELSDKTIGLIGFGAIGQLVALHLQSFGVNLLVHDPFQPENIIQQHGGRHVTLDELLQQSDVISLHARGDESQPPLIGARELSKMKPTSYLINTARAYLIDHDALVCALQQHQIAGAALDVFEHEPIPADSPFRQLDNVTLTPHLAGSTREAYHRCPYLLVDMIKPLINHRPDITEP